MSLFTWNKKPKSRQPSQARGSVAAPDEIDQAAAETEASGAAEPTNGKTAEIHAIDDQRFTVPPEWASALVKGCFSPLAKYDHPAWELTDDEAEPVVPKMQVAIQAVLDRHMPDWADQMMRKYPEMISLTWALAMLYYVKFKAVRLIRMEEYREEQKRIAEMKKAEAAAPSPTRDLIYEPVPAGQALPIEEPPQTI